MDRALHQYSALLSKRHIRLLKIRDIDQCSKNNPSPSFEVQTCPLDDAPLFQAVSYTRGSNERCHRLAISDGSELAITSNLRVALPFLTATADTQYLWIDQISIDQDNTNERNMQVAVMGDIFRAADSVLVWLGEGSASTPLLKELVAVCDNPKLDQPLRGRVTHPEEAALVAWAQQCHDSSCTCGFYSSVKGEATAHCPPGSLGINDAVAPCKHVLSFWSIIRDAVYEVFNSNWVRTLADPRDR